MTKIGIEIRNTPLHGMKTLYVTGIQEVSLIVQEAHWNECTAIYLGTNDSFKPKDYDEWREWEEFIHSILDSKCNFYCAIEFDVNFAEEFLESCLADNNKLVPIVSVKMPYLSQLGYNAVLKIDDKEFGATNEGEWHHRIHDLRNTEAFNSWDDIVNSIQSDIQDPK